MIGLKKYVLHVPHDYLDSDDEGGIDKRPIENLDSLLNELYMSLQENEHNFYTFPVKSHYNGQAYDETLIVSFANTNDILSVFFNWFGKNMDVLRQQSVAYEIDNSLSILPSKALKHYSESD